MKKITWVDLALGVWLIASPLVLGYSTSRLVLAENTFPGVFLIATSIWVLALAGFHRRVEWAQSLSGIWLILGSFVLLFRHLSGAAANDLIIGIAVLWTGMFAASKAGRIDPHPVA